MIVNPMLYCKNVSEDSSGNNTVFDPKKIYDTTRPSDWLQMPDPQDNEIYLLFHIPDGVSSLLAFTVTCEDSYQVSFGTVSGGQFVATGESYGPYESGSKFETELFSGDFGDLTSDGFKQVMIKVYGNKILTWESSTHSRKTTPVNYANWNVVEILCKLSEGTIVKCGNKANHSALQRLRYFNWLGENSLTDAADMFRSCYELMTIQPLDTSSVTIMSNMFANCYSLMAIPPMDTSSVTNMEDTFFNCYSLKTVPEMDTSSVTNIAYLFSGCYSLMAIPPLDTSSATTMNQMFYNCCSLKTVPEMDTSSVTIMNQMFGNCYSLLAIPQLDTSAATNMNNAFYNCYSLSKVTLNPDVSGWAGQNIVLTNASLVYGAIIDFFNSLPTITTSKKITLTANPGVSELTDSDKAIATDKNWTLTL